MAAILKLRRGTSFSSPQISEPFFDTSKGTLLVGTGSSEYVTLARLSSGSDGKVNTGDFWVDGNVTASHLNLSGDITARNTTLSGDIIIGGNIFLGDSLANDNITILASLSGSLIPSESAQYDLGSEIRKWNELWVVSASIDDIKVPGSGILSSSVTDFVTYSSSVDSRLVDAEWTGSDHETRVDKLEWTGSNHETRIDKLEWTGSNHETRLDEIEGPLSTSLDSRLDYLEVTFSQSVDSRLDDAEWTGSNQESRLDTIETTFSSSVDLRLDNAEWTGSNHENRIDEIETTFSSSVDSRLDYLEGPFSTSVDGRLDELEGPFSTSVDDRLDKAEWTGSNHETRLDTLETTFSSSVDSRLDDLEWTGSNHESRLDEIETTFSSSVDSRLDDLEWTGSNHEDRIDEIETTFSSSVDSRLDDAEWTGSNQETRLDTLETTFSSSVDTRLDYLEGPFSTSVDSQLDEIHSYTSSLKTAIDVDGSNLTVLGNLTVQGTQTSLNTTELLVEDKLLAIASGSTTSEASDGAGLYISGADASLLWNHTDNLLEVNTKFSSSVGFKGDGSEIQNIQHGNIVFGGSNIVSGSDQVSGSIYGDVSGDITISNLGVASISNNVIINDDVKSDAAISHTKLDFDGSNIVTGSDQVSGSIYGDISGDITINSSGVASIESGVIVNADVNATAGILHTKLNFGGSNIVSGSSQVNHDSTTGFVANEHINHTSVTITAGDGLDGGGDISQTRTLTLDTGSNHFNNGVKEKLDNETVISGSDQVTSSLDLRYLEIEGDNVVSGSDQVSGSIYSTVSGDISINNLGVASIGSGVIVNNDVKSDAQIAWTKLDLGSSNIVTGSDQVTGSLNNLYEPIASGTNTLVSSSVLGSTSQGTARLTTNGTNGSNVNLGLRTSDSPSFQGITLTNLSVLGSSEVNAIISGSGGTLGYRALGTAAFFNVSASVGNDPNSIPTNAAVDAALIAAGAGDITAVNNSSLYPSSQTGLKHTTQGTNDGGTYGTQGNVVLALDTGSVHFTNGVTEALPTGIISSSAQIDSDLFDIDGLVSSSTQISNYGVFAELNGDGLVSSSTQISNYGVFAELNGDNLVSSSAQVIDLLPNGVISGSTQISDIFLKYNGDDVVSGSVLRPNGDSVVSGSSQIDVTQTTNYSSINQYSDTKVKTKLNAETVISGSSQVDFFNLDNLPSGIVSQSLLNDLTNGEVNQLKNINSVTISNTQWGYLGGLDQSLAQDSNVTFDTGSFTGNLTINGNLTILGDAAEIQVSQLRIQDKLITVASGSADSLAANGAGIQIAGANESITWDHSNSRFNISDDTHVVGNLTATADVVAYQSSDKELKENIIPISDSLEKINQIGGYSFTWNEEKQHIYKGKDYGVIAQEIEKILPELVDTRENGYKAVKYDRLVSLLIEGIKDLSKQVDELKNKLG